MHDASCVLLKSLSLVFLYLQRQTYRQFLARAYIHCNTQTTLSVAAQAVAQLEAETQQVFHENQQLNKQSNLLNTDVGDCARLKSNILQELYSTCALLNSDASRCLCTTINDMQKKRCVFALPVTFAKPFSVCNAACKQCHTQSDQSPLSRMIEKVFRCYV